MRAFVAAHLLLLAPALGAAAAPRVAVLTPSADWTPECSQSGGKRDERLRERCAVLETLADEARAGALAALEGRDFIVMTRENTAQLLEEMGAGAAACSEGACEVEQAKLVGADYVVSGTVVQVEGSWFATLKLHAVGTARLLKTSDRVKGRSLVELIEALRAATETMVRAGLGLGGGKAAAVAAPAPTAGVAAPPFAAAVSPCPEGQEAAAGHCCWPGQDWGASAGRCVGTPACPDGFLAKEDGCLPGCAPGKSLVGGRCCWPGQDWGARAGKCIGTPTCPRGLRLEAGECVDAPPGMVRLPGGRFKMGTRGDTVTVAPFFLDQTEVPIQAYAECVKAGRCSEPDTGQYCNWEKADRANHPVNCVDWKQATAYCAAAGKRLPTEEEWEWAARGAERGTTWPWGNDAPRDQLCWNGGAAKRYSRRGGEGLGTCPVGSFVAGNSPHGLVDLAGNVVEWTSSPYDASKKRVFRGGCWGDEASSLVSASNRIGYDPGDETGGIGLRCAKTAP